MYQLGSNNVLTGQPNCIRRLSDNASIPFDPANTDYQAYLKWVDAGNVPAPADEGTQ